ncbi:MAG: GspE/PulE family protein [Alistipes sp.]|nr:GspE/PulE family protein [Alistipes sp.]
MNNGGKISTEAIQSLTASQAWEYRLLPYGLEADRIQCYSDSVDEHKILELEVLYGIRVILTEIETPELDRLLTRYYRNDSPREGDGSRVAVTEISSGQGFLTGLIEEAFDMYASDIHIEPYEQRCRIRSRMDGKLIERYVVKKENYASLINQIKILANLDISEKRLPQDGRILFNRNDKKFDVRVSTLPTIHGEKSVLRLLTRHVELLELSNLGFTAKQLEDYCSAIGKPHGMVLICGPTGSGKSTTLYATLRKLNNDTGNILTIEDPVEYTLEGVNQVQLKEEIGLTFTSALRTFLRQDPDIIMLGEIRDADTAHMAIRSSLTGHLLFSTIHTNSAWGSISRLVDMGIHPYLIANTLILCVAQHLVRILCPECKKEAEADGSLSEHTGTGKGCLYTAVGCPKCYYTGYSGRKAIYEVIPLDEELSAAARQNTPEVGELLRKREITTLKDEGMRMLASGITSLEEVLPLLKQ